MQIENVNRLEKDVDKAILNSYIAEIKERLRAYKTRKRDIDNQLRRLDSIEAKLLGLGSLSYSGMPRVENPVGDKVADTIALKICVEEDIEKRKEQQEEELEKLERIVNSVYSPDEKAVIRMRYFDGEGWSEIADELFGNSSDFYVREDSYIRRVHRLHGKALRDMAESVWLENEACKKS